MDIPTIVAWSFFALSEILPLVNTRANGIFHSLILGLGKSFSKMPPEIMPSVPSPELAIISALQNNPETIPRLIKILENTNITKPESVFDLEKVIVSSH